MHRSFHLSILQGIDLQSTLMPASKYSTLLSELEKLSDPSSDLVNEDVRQTLAEALRKASKRVETPLEFVRRVSFTVCSQSTIAALTGLTIFTRSSPSNWSQQRLVPILVYLKRCTMSRPFPSKDLPERRVLSPLSSADYYDIWPLLA